ncbi:MAG: HNH endonuclease [Actinobacteria bacterium]|nr:HNH endonuclease [Actinomycetota bacterium]
MRVQVRELLTRMDARAAQAESGAGEGEAVVLPELGGWEELVIYAQTSERDPALAELDDGELEDHCRRQAALAAATMGRWLRLLREVLVRGVWAIEGARTPAAWLSYTVGMASSTAREHCRVALRLPSFPQVQARLEAGELSYSKARAITRVSDPRLEPLLVRFAEQATGEQLDQIIAGFTRSVRAQQQGVPAWDRASLTSAQLDHELTQIRIVVPTADAQAALARLDAYVEAVRREAVAAAKQAGEDPVLPTQLVQRVEALLAAAERLAVEVAQDVSGADAATLVIHADVEQLTPPESGQDRVEVVETVTRWGRRRAAMSARTLQRLACSARYALIGHDQDGDTAGVSGTTRRIPPRLRRALLARDGTCRFPGCHRSRGLHGHHIIPVEREGPTVLENLIVLCGYHHTFVHERDWVIIHDGKGRARFKPPTGPPLPTTRAMLGASAEARDWRRYDPDILRARDGTPADYDSCVMVLHQELRRLENPAQLANAA